MIGHAGLLHLLPCRMRRYKESKLWCQVGMPLQDESPHPTIEARPMLWVGLATNIQSGGHRPLLVKLCQHLMSQTCQWLEITFSPSEIPMPFERVVLVDQVCWQMKASSISPRLRPDSGMALGCMTLEGCALTQQRPKMLMLLFFCHLLFNQQTRTICLCLS